MSGFSRTVSGETMAYTSPIASARTGLIARASDGRSSIAWETAAVPAEQSAGTFIWLAGMGTNLGEYRFTLRANGKEVAAFATQDRNAWEVTGAGGARLSFQTMMVDRHRDRFGFMKLTLPPELLVPGKPVELQVTGEAARSSGWVMTFTTPLEEGISASSRPVILKESGKSVQPLDLDIVNLGEPATASIRVGDMPEEKVPVPYGITRHSVKLAPVDVETRFPVQFAMRTLRTVIQATVPPVRHWTVYLVQHSHTDIGYTRPQTEILAEHLRYIDYALDYCDQTDGYPPEAQFRWTCETSWAVREYLRTRPAKQIARLKKRVLEGRIEVTGMLLNWAEVADENALVHSLEPVKVFRDLGLPVKTAMQDDVNGYGWCFVDYLNGLGIRYVTSGINAARALKPFAVPTPFWWESPSGKRVLAYRADHYMTGNFYGIHTEDFDLIARDLPGYLRQLETDGYPYARVNVQHSGYSTDNSPPSTFSCENVRRWNQTFEWPRLRTATVHEFLEWVEKEHGAHLPVYRAAWPDWWTDGYGCAVRETAAGRLAQADLIVNQGLLSMAQIFGAALPEVVFQQVSTVADHLHFYNEHTFGAAESISDPMAENSQVQWSEKASYPWQAVMQSRLLREAALGQIQDFLPQSDEPGIVVLNTLSWHRSGLHVLYADNQVLPKEVSFRIVDEKGTEIPVQLMQSRPEGNYWALWVNEVPPFGYRAYRIKTGTGPRTAEPAFKPDGIIENSYYRLSLDRAKGAITSLVDRELGKELLDPARSRQLGEFIYERLADRRSLEELQRGKPTHTTLNRVRITPGVDGPVWQSVILAGSNEGFSGEDGVVCEIRLFKPMKRIDLIFRARKLPVSEPEAAYVAFPFSLDQGRLIFEAQGGLVHPGENQIPGTVTDWNTIQNFAALQSPQAQIVLISNEIPLVQFGGINTGRFKPGAKPESQQIFSWVLNNYWTTNFRSSQEGEMSWSYALTSGPDTGSAYAARFGWGVRIPFVSRVLPRGKTSSALQYRSAWPFTESSVILVASRPAREGILLHLRETAGQAAPLTFGPSGKGWKMEEVDPLGAPIAKPGAVNFLPYETKFIRIWK